MTRSFHDRLMLAAASLALAACSSAQSQEAEVQPEPNTAIVMQSAPELATALDAPPADILPAPEMPPPLTTPDSDTPEHAAPEAAPPDQLAPSHDLPLATCEIVIERTANGVRLTPLVHANRALDGEFSLQITKSGPGGTSDISQGGPFAAARGDNLDLSASEFSLERGARFRAVLTLIRDGREICRDVRS